MGADLEHGEAPRCSQLLDPGRIPKEVPSTRSNTYKRYYCAPDLGVGYVSEPGQYVETSLSQITPQ